MSMSMRMNRRDFVKLGAMGAGAFLSKSQVATALPESPGFATRHLVTIILGSGARTEDVIGNLANAPFQTRMARAGTLFIEDYGETVGRHGYAVSEVLTGRDAPSQRPRYPTWHEYVRKKTDGRASELWNLQAASYYRAWTWDVKHFSSHPDYGVRYGATSLTMNKLFRATTPRSAAEVVRRRIDPGLGHAPEELARIAAFLADGMASGQFELPSTREPVIEREVPLGDCRALVLAGEILRAFKPRMITVQILGLDQARAERGLGAQATDYEAYVKHIKTTDELVGRLWSGIQSDPYFRATTSLLIRPDGGRDASIDAFGHLGQSPGDPSAHTVWTTAVGPDFKKGHIVTERVQRRDLAPTITYLMSGQAAEHATGCVRTQLFDDRYRLPRYVPPPTAEMPAGVVNWGSPSRSSAVRGD